MTDTPKSPGLTFEMTALIHVSPEALAQLKKIMPGVVALMEDILAKDGGEISPELSVLWSEALKEIGVPISQAAVKPWSGQKRSFEKPYGYLIKIGDVEIGVALNQYRILAALQQAGAPMTLKELAEVRGDTHAPATQDYIHALSALIGRHTGIQQSIKPLHRKGREEKLEDLPFQLLGGVKIRFFVNGQEETFTRGEAGLVKPLENPQAKP